jgi:hypothetical protein
MDSIKIQFVYTYEEPSGFATRKHRTLLEYLQHIVPHRFELNSDLVSAALSLDMEGLINAMQVKHPGDTIQFKHVQYERIKDHHHNRFKTKISLRSEVFKILDSPVCHGKRMTFIGIEGEGDRIRSYNVILNGLVKYILSNHIRQVKTKKLLKLTG